MTDEQQLRRKILLVDDEAIIALAEARTLERHGFNVARVYSGEDAVRTATSDDEISLILMDVDLGRGMDGTEAAERILSTRTLPIVFLTSHAEQAMVERVKGITRYGYVLKNSGEFVLIESINMAVELFESHQRTQEREYHLNERIKELNCLYELERLVSRRGLSEEGLLQGAVDLIPPSWQYPEITCARACVDDFGAITTGFRETEWKLESVIRIDGQPGGRIEVCYLEARPERHEGPFLYEERALLDAAAARLGEAVERKRAEERLRASERKYRALYQAAEDAVYLFSLRGDVLEANDSACAMLGRARDELIGSNIGSINACFTSESFAELWRNAPEHACRSGGTVHVRKDGSLFHVEFSAVMFRSMGEPQICAIVRDVTERRQAERDLLIKERAMETALNGIAIADLTGHLTYVNAAFVEMWGYATRGELLGRPATDFIVEKDRIPEIIQSIMDGHNAVFELTGLRSDGSTFRLRLSASGVIDRHGAPVSLMGSFVRLS